MRAVPVALLILAAAFTGCLHDLGLEADFGNVVAAVRLLGSESEAWQNESFRMILREPVVRIGKPEPGPIGGGGVARTLTAPVNFTLEAALEGSDRFADATALWTIYDDEFRLVADERLRGNELLQVPITNVGRYQVTVALGKGLRIDEETRRLEVVLDPRWIVESSVHPVRPPQVNPPNYDQMADRFSVPITGRSAQIDAATRFRGTWPGPNGTNIDLAGQFAATGFRCSPAPATAPSQPGPNQARENVTVQASSGFAPIVHVGGLPAPCPGMAQSTYANPYSVPYRLFLNLTYPTYNSKSLRVL